MRKASVPRETNSPAFGLQAASTFRERRRRVSRETLGAQQSRQNVRSRGCRFASALGFWGLYSPHVLRRPRALRSGNPARTNPLLPGERNSLRRKLPSGRLMKAKAFQSSQLPAEPTPLCRPRRHKGQWHPAVPPVLPRSSRDPDRALVVPRVESWHDGSSLRAGSSADQDE